jgi:hypothetical protein
MPDPSVHSIELHPTPSGPLYDFMFTRTMISQHRVRLVATVHIVTVHTYSQFATMRWHLILVYTFNIILSSVDSDDGSKKPLRGQHLRVLPVEVSL